MHLILPNDEQLSLDFEPLQTLVRDRSFFIQELVNQLNGGGRYCHLIGWRDAVREAAGGIAVDLGANVGLFSIYMSAMAKTVYAVEPSQENYQAMCDIIRAAAINNIIPINKAVWIKNGAERFYRNLGNKTMNSIYATGNHVETTVECVRIDQLLNDYSIDEVALLKCDIEGSEVDLLRDPTFPDFAGKIRTLYLEIHNFKERGNLKVLSDEMCALLKHCFPIVKQLDGNTILATRQ